MVILNPIYEMQVKYKTTDKQVFDYTGDISDPRVERIVKRLNNATNDEDIRLQMWAEEEVDGEIEALNRELETYRQANEEEKKAKEAALALVEKEKIEKEQLFPKSQTVEMQLTELQKQVAELLMRLNEKSDN